MTAISLLLGLLPALLLFAALVVGRYPGERVLARLRLQTRPRAVTDPRPRAAHFVRAVHRRLGELLSGALAGRAPPALPA